MRQTNKTNIQLAEEGYCVISFNIVSRIDRKDWVKFLRDRGLTFAYDSNIS